MTRKSKIPDFETRPPAERRCDHPECEAEALYRAPKSRDNVNDYFWFCLDHVRAYNRAWNYYKGMNEFEIEAEIRNDTVWRRPTWPLGGGFRHRAQRFTEAPFKDGFGIFDDMGPEAEAKPEGDNYDAALRQSFRIMDIEPPITLTELKTRYKELVKKLHPDVNGGDSAAEDRLKEINQAYAALKKVVPA